MSLLKSIVILGLVLQGYISNTSKPGYIGIQATVWQPIRIVDVYHGTPAERAGLQVNDEIATVDGQKGGEIKGEPGTPVTLLVKRGGQVLTFVVVRAPLVEMPPDFPVERDPKTD